MLVRCVRVWERRCGSLEKWCFDSRGKSGNRCVCARLEGAVKYDGKEPDWKRDGTRRNKAMYLRDGTYHAVQEASNLIFRLDRVLNFWASQMFLVAKLRGPFNDHIEGDIVFRWWLIWCTNRDYW